MLLDGGAVAKLEGGARYAEEYWPLLTKWAEYLRDKGMDPENQLAPTISPATSLTTPTSH